MIIGLGIDQIEIARVAKTWQRYGNRFGRRVYTEAEWVYCLSRPHPAQSMAGRFAAKEAAMKALGTGHSRGVTWRSVEVVRRDGPPQLAFHAGAGARLSALGGDSSLLTITHSNTLAFAHVLLLGS